ncbi:MAG: crossover junction endodeoxyribonuclease RuvC [Alphaproteobacteria bacterium]|nr:crossover junction endodeoxyribonuclease RuvC [Alphaproteobacteria bacterium]
MKRILGIDPGLQRTGWGIVSIQGNALSYIASGVIKTDGTDDVFARLVTIEQELDKVITLHQPTHAAIEETFMNNNAASAIKLGMARGAAALVPARHGLKVAEYAANTVKKSVVGAGHADKAQIQAMVKILLPQAPKSGADEADALAIAICHAHHI